METRSGKRRAKSASRPSTKAKSVKKTESIPNSCETNETEDSEEQFSLSQKADQICKEIKNIDEKYSKIDMSEWNLDDIAEQLGKADTECTVQLTSADDVEESENDHFACDEIYANGAKEIKRRMGTRQVRDIGKSARSITAVPQLTYIHLRWLIRVKIAKELHKIMLGKLHSFYHINFTIRKEMPSALIRTTMFSENQFKYICGSLRGLFVKNKPLSELNYTLHVLLPETLIRIVMFVKNVNYKDAQNLMDKHLFDKPMPSKEALQ